MHGSLGGFAICDLCPSVNYSSIVVVLRMGDMVILPFKHHLG
jgi:hypothetical protein